MVTFRDKGAAYGYGVYVCTDPKIAACIEAHPDYGSIITKEETEEVVEKVETEYKAVYPDAKRTQEANRILVNEYGYDKEKLKSKEDALKAAEELNISFPNL